MSQPDTVVAANENAASNGLQPAAAGAEVKTLHPGMPDDRFLAILAVAAREALGASAVVVRFRHMDSMDWTWSIQGRVGIHNSHNL